MKKEAAQKLPKGVSPEFSDSLNTLTIDQLKGLIVQLQVQNQENEAFKETPEFLEAQAEYDYAKEQYNMATGGYKETSVSLKNRTKLVVERLRDKGGC